MVIFFCYRHYPEGYQLIVMYLITFPRPAFFPCVLTCKLDSSSSDHLPAQIVLLGSHSSDSCSVLSPMKTPSVYILLASFLYALCSLLPWSVLQNSVVDYSLLWEISLEFESWKNWKKSCTRVGIYRINTEC